MSESTVNSVIQQILNSNIVQIKSHFNYFLKLLTKEPILRPQSTILFNIILKELIPHIKSQFTSFEISTIFQTKSQVLLLIEEKVLQINNIYSKSIDDTSFFMFFYGDLKRKFSSFCKSKIQENKFVENFVEKVNWEEFKEERKKFINQDEIAASIREDNVDVFIEKVHRFQNKIKKENSIDIRSINPNELNFNIRIEHSVIETTSPINDLKEMPTLIEYSAFFGSINIFLFLATKIGKSQIITNSPNLAYFASIGGNIEIIQYLLDLEIEFDKKCTNCSIEFHRYEASNLICPHPDYLTLFLSISHNNFRYFYDHLNVIEKDQSFNDTDTFLRFFDYSYKNLPLYFTCLLFRMPIACKCSLFSRIAKTCNLAIIEAAVANIKDDFIDINQNDKNGFNALHYACLNDSKEVASFLLGRPNIDPNYPTDAQNIKVKYLQMTPLHIVSLNKNVEICKMLLNHPKIEVNKPIKNKSITPLMTASSNTSCEIVDLLLKCPSIDVNCIDQQGRNALHHAVLAKYSLEIIIALVLSGIELNAKTKERPVTPFLLAVENNKLEIVSYFCSLDDEKYKLDFTVKETFGILK